MKASVAGLDRMEMTALLTLYARALDNRSAQPILRDQWADRVSRAIDYDFEALNIRASVRCPVALRAKLLDAQVCGFVAHYPDAVIVDLGAGLSSGYLRTQPPPGVDWYNVDLPGLTALRQELMPSHGNEHHIAARIEDPGWAKPIPPDRHTLVIADGLTGFLSQPTILNLFDTVTSHFDSGILAFNDYGPIGRATRAAVKIAPERFGAFTPTNPGFGDARTPESWNGRLKLMAETHLAHCAEVELFPAKLRSGVKVTRYIPALSRKWRVLSYRF